MDLKFKKLLPLLCAIFTLFSSCGEKENSLSDQNENSYGLALIIVVENNDGLLSSTNETYFQIYKSQVLSILSEIFQVPISAIENLSLNEIVEQFGEDWQINQIRNLAIDKYDQIFDLKNEKATSNNLKQILLSLHIQNYTVDMIFCLHGNEKTFYMYNNEKDYIQDFANFIKNNKINLRVLYQTCCFAGKALDKWEISGVAGVNGATGINYITLFSPGYFLKEWIKGQTFQEAVQIAFSRDLEKLASYDDRIPVKKYLLTQDAINNSLQLVGGKNPKIRFLQK